MTKCRLLLNNLPVAIFQKKAVEMLAARNVTKSGIATGLIL